MIAPDDKACLSVSIPTNNDTEEDFKPNVRDLAKRFEAMSPIKMSLTKKPQTVRATKQRALKVPVLSVSVSNRPPPVLRRKRSSRRPRTGEKLSNSVTELRIFTGPTDMAIRRKSSAKMKKSKSADANIASFLTPLALAVETPKSTAALPTAASPVSMMVKPQVPPKPTIMSHKTPPELATTGRVSQMIQQRHEELGKLSVKIPVEAKTSHVPAATKSTNQQRPKIPPPSPDIVVATNAATAPASLRTNPLFKNRRTVVRKPSHRPPAPPVNPKPQMINIEPNERLAELLNQLNKSDTSGQSETSLEASAKTIRCRLPDGTEVPLLPKIPAPLPPQTPFEDDSNGLYEEIQYEFMMKEHEKNKDGQEQAVFINGCTSQFENKSPVGQSPLESYHSSHPDLNKPDLREYNDVEHRLAPTATQTLGRADVQSIVAALRNEKFFKNSPTAANAMTGSVNSHAMSHSGVWTSKMGGKKTMSTLDVEKLSQLKTGLQSKMDWLRQKVSTKKTTTPTSGRQRTISGRQLSTIEPIDDSRYYSDDWSTDEEENDGMVNDDERCAKSSETENSRFVAKKYEYVDIWPLTKQSLLAEIESAYQGIKTGETTELQDVDMNEHQKSRCSSPNTNLATDALFETQSCCSSSAQEEDEDCALNIKSLSDEMQNSTITDDTESLSDLERKSLYESRLPVEQPLYQIYMLHEQKLLNDSQLLKPPSSTIDTILNAHLNDEHEADSVCDSSNDTDDVVSISVRRQSSTVSTDSGRGGDVSSSQNTSNSSMRRDRLTAGSAFGSQRSLWCELAEVKSAGLLANLDDKSRKLQEAYFEVITSEASYLRSLNVLVTNFVDAPELQGPKKAVSIITSGERKHLFSNVLAIRDCSENLLRDLETRLKDSLVLNDVCDILSEHLEKRFNSYVLYCSNQVYQDRVLKRLKATNSQFLACLKKIELRRELHGLDLRSFLMLPMQRATRYRLLLFAILEHVPSNTSQEFTANRALNLANMLVQNCNEGARLLERTEQLLEIERRLVYKSADLKRIPLVSKNRYVVKTGQLTQFVEKRYRPKLNMLQTRQKTRLLYLFLFSDLILITSKKTNGTFAVKDYAMRRFIEIEPLETNSHKIPFSLLSALPSKPHLFLLVLMQNARGKQSEFLLNTESETDRERWLSSIRPPVCSNPDEKIYAAWDCPQVLCRHNYDASQEDELSLQENDLVNVLRKMPDGWFFGERVRDGHCGWFPFSYVQQVMNDHVRANNYRHRFKIIQAANDLQHQQASRTQDKRVSLATIHQPPFKDRLRRLSNPKAFFGN